MYATSTATVSRTSTYTEARVRYVMDKVFDDLVTIAVREFASIELLSAWSNDIRAVLNLQAAEFFEIQLTKPDGKSVAIRYAVVDDGSIIEDEESGGQNLFALPNGTSVRIVIRLRDSATKREAALAYLKRRGWGTNGTVLQGESTGDRGYSKDGYGVRRQRIGNWQ